MSTSATQTAPAAAKAPQPASTPAEGTPTDGPHAEYTDGYGAGTAVRSLELTDLIAIEGLAAQVIPKGGFDYIAGGAGNEWTLHANRTAFDSRQIMPRVLTNFEKPDLRTQVLGVDLALPVVVLPMGAQGLAHSSAEAGAAQGTAAAGSLYVASTVSTLSLEEIAAASTGPKWLSLYLTQDRGFTRELLHRAKAAGYRAIVMTVDVTATGDRESDVRNHFVFPVQEGNMPNGGRGGSLASQNSVFATKLGPEDVAFVIKESGLPVIVKGIMHPDDAISCRSGARALASAGTEPAPTGSCTEADCTCAASGRPSVSATACRLRPATCLPAS